MFCFQGFCCKALASYKTCVPPALSWWKCDLEGAEAGGRRAWKPTSLAWGLPNPMKPPPKPVPFKASEWHLQAVQKTARATSGVSTGPAEGPGIPGAEGAASPQRISSTGWAQHRLGSERLIPTLTRTNQRMQMKNVVLPG